jgi:hypothetical protein
MTEDARRLARKAPELNHDLDQVPKALAPPAQGSSAQVLAPPAQGSGLAPPTEGSGGPVD